MIGTWAGHNGVPYPGGRVETVKRCHIILICLLAALTALTGCGGDASGRTVSARRETSVTLTFISSWGGNDPNADTIQQIIDKFTAENPGIHVSNQSVFGDDFLTYLKTAFVSGSDPDVFGLWPGSDINSLVKAGKVADLTDMIHGDSGFQSSFRSDMWQYVTQNGRIYGVPVEIIFEGLFINRDLFDKYGATVPQTFAQLLDAVRVFRKNGVIPIAYNNTAEGTYIYQNIAASIGGKSAVENPFASGSVNRCYIEAMEDMRQLYELGAFPSDFTQIDSNERNSLFKNKKAAMIVQGSWFTADVAADPGVEFVRFPNCGGSSAPTRIIYGLGNGVFHISEKAWADPVKSKAAVKLLKYIASRQSAALLAGQTGMLSNVDIGADTSYNRLTVGGLQLIRNSAELIGPPDSYISRPAWQNVIVNEFPLVLEGTRQPESIWSDAARAGASEN